MSAGPKPNYVSYKRCFLGYPIESIALKELAECKGIDDMWEIITNWRSSQCIMVALITLLENPNALSKYKHFGLHTNHLYSIPDLKTVKITNSDKTYRFVYQNEYNDGH